MIRISVGGDAADRDLRSLADWLRREPAIQHHATISLETPPPEPGRMGAGFDAIQLAVDSAFQLANLAIAIAAWRRSRAATPTIVVNGTVVLDHTKLDPDVIARELRAGGVEDEAAGP